MRGQKWVYLGLVGLVTQVSWGGTAYDAYVSHDIVSRTLRKMRLSGHQIAAFRQRYPELRDLKSYRTRGPSYILGQLPGSEETENTQRGYFPPNEAEGITNTPPAIDIDSSYSSLETVVAKREKEGTLTLRNRIEAQVVRDHRTQLQKQLQRQGKSDGEIRDALSKSYSDTAFKVLARTETQFRYAAYQTVKNRVLAERRGALEVEMAGESDDSIDTSWLADSIDPKFAADVARETESRKVELAFESTYERLKWFGKLDEAGEKQVQAIRDRLLSLRKSLEANGHSEDEIEIAQHTLMRSVNVSASR